MATTRPEPSAPDGRAPGKKKGRNLGGEGAVVREQLQSITADCKTALADA
jgi:hypothetical protein